MGKKQPPLPFPPSPPSEHYALFSVNYPPLAPLPPSFFSTSRPVISPPPPLTPLDTERERRGGVNEGQARNRVQLLVERRVQLRLCNEPLARPRHRFLNQPFPSPLWSSVTSRR